MPVLTPRLLTAPISSSIPNSRWNLSKLYHTFAMLLWRSVCWGLYLGLLRGNLLAFSRWLLVNWPSYRLFGSILRWWGHLRRLLACDMNSALTWAYSQSLHRSHRSNPYHPWHSTQTNSNPILNNPSIYIISFSIPQVCSYVYYPKPRSHPNRPQCLTPPISHNSGWAHLPTSISISI